MRPHIEPFKRLYAAGRITLEQLTKRLTTGKITQKEFDYITGKEE